MGFSVEHLQRLLKEESQKRQLEKEDKTARRAQNAPLVQNLETIWKAHGVLAPMSGCWERSFPDHLYQCSLSAPQTTLVAWSSLPQSVRSRLPKSVRASNNSNSNQGDDEDRVVEVPLAYIQIDEENDYATPGDSNGNASGRSRTKDRLGGNLTNKLSEYTRGVAGRTKLFSPGGMGSAADYEDYDGSNAEVDDFLSEAAVQRSLEVLDKGSAASWKDGSLLKAPPGVAFKVGLTWDDVHGQPEKVTETSKEQNEELVAGAVEEEAHDDGNDDIIYNHADEPPYAVPTERTSSSSNIRPSSNFSAPAWTANDFLDDDSLFGSSDDSDSDESEVETRKKRKGGFEDSLSDDDSSDEEEGDGGKDSNQQTVATDQATDADATSISTDPNEVDELLLELSLPGNTDLEAKNKQAIANNPLVLAERQSQDQQNTTRKMWATTDLLPIHDINTWIPNPAMTFPFTLDGFQQQAIVRLERNESVFVAAHTSAGKTAVAEYAVAMARQRGTRAIYTSPIKALSNQKFRDFSLKFGSENVGLITGDMQINADDSTCIIMTTEILRSMLYRGADLIRDIEFVIFDEVHYINDSERGVVWEETIILLPANVNLIFLSATTPNTLEFSDWIGRTKRRLVHVVKTDYRPVPLSHHLWANLKLHKIMEGKSGFLDKGYAEATRALLPASAKDKSSNKKGAGQKPKPAGRPATGSKQLAWQAQGSKQNWMSLIRYLDRELLTPTVVFSFSKKKCEEIARMLSSLDLNTAAERGIVKGFTLQTRARLSEEDSYLPQVLTISEMVERGIGVHHGGLLPILKEMVELLFSRNLIKVLFATETFAMGVNMPARAVVFNSIRKHDGLQFRSLQPGEYVQMAGRAGRRGLDTVGTVIMCAFGTEPPPLPMLRNMLIGQSTLLKSQFRLTYNMILNLLRVEEMSVESMIKRSFSEFATQRALTANDYPKLLARGTHTLAKLDEAMEAEADIRIGAEDIDEYYQACTHLLAANDEILSYVMEATNGSAESVLMPGRVVLVTAARKYGIVRAPAIVLRPTARKPGSIESSAIICVVLLPESYVPTTMSNDARSTKMPANVGYIGSAERRYFELCEVGLGEVLVVTGTKHKISFKDLLQDSSNSSAGAQRPGSRDFFAAAPSNTRKAEADNPFAGMKTLGATRTKVNSSDNKVVATSSAGQEIDQTIKYLVAAEEDERNSGVPVMDIKDCSRCGSDVVEFRQLFTQMERMVVEARSFVSHQHPGLERVYTPVERKETLRSKVEALRHLLSNESLSLFPDFLQRKAVLCELGYVDENETVAIKGRVACEVNTCDELIATEMVFEGILNDLEPQEIVAVLSALVFQDKSGEEELDLELPDSLRNCCKELQTIAFNLGQLQKKNGLEIDPLDYVESTLNFGLVHVVYEWALGVSFSKICELTLVQEGTIVRSITRLDELCREVRNCARAVGNPTLYRKMEVASVMIKRDIVFASSLYVS